MIWILFLAASLFLLYIVLRGKKSNTNYNTNINNTYAIDSIEVNKDYAKGAINFFDSYLSLCKKHSIVGVCNLLSVETDDLGIKTKMECIISAVDGEHADEAFDMVKRVWTQIRQEKKNSGDYSAATYAGDSYIKSYFGCEDLHYIFTGVDEYQFDNSQVIISFEKYMFTREGAKWQPTLYYIKQELHKKWESVNISIDKGGIVVEA